MLRRAHPWFSALRPPSWSSLTRGPHFHVGLGPVAGPASVWEMAPGLDPIFRTVPMVWELSSPELDSGGGWDRPVHAHTSLQPGARRTEMSMETLPEARCEEGPCRPQGGLAQLPHTSLFVKSG